MIFALSTRLSESRYHARPLRATRGCQVAGDRGDEQEGRSPDLISTYKPQDGGGRGIFLVTDKKNVADMFVLV